ncbi:Uncharacterised protein [Mycobacteroides abscessus subsp. abscessus]|nr:Uncharacterised protein [Mycobacteroides abscessus subsp. abscessus]
MDQKLGAEDANGDFGRVLADRQGHRAVDTAPLPRVDHGLRLRKEAVGHGTFGGEGDVGTGSAAEQLDGVLQMIGELGDGELGVGRLLVVVCLGEPADDLV